MIFIAEMRFKVIFYLVVVCYLRPNSGINESDWARNGKDRCHLNLNFSHLELVLAQDHIVEDLFGKTMLSFFSTWQEMKAISTDFKVNSLLNWLSVSRSRLPARNFNLLKTSNNNVFRNYTANLCFFGVKRFYFWRKNSMVKFREKIIKAYFCPKPLNSFRFSGSQFLPLSILKKVIPLAKIYSFFYYLTNWLLRKLCQIIRNLTLLYN